MPLSFLPDNIIDSLVFCMFVFWPYRKEINISFYQRAFHPIQCFYYYYCNILGLVNMQDCIHLHHHETTCYLFILTRMLFVVTHQNPALRDELCAGKSS